MKNKLIFSIIDLLLIAVTGVIFGLSCYEHIFSTSTGVASFVSLLVTLFLPTLIYLLKEKINTAHIVVSSLLVLGEVVMNIVFIARPDFALINFGISQGVILATYLCSLLAVLAFYKADEA